MADIAAELKAQQSVVPNTTVMTELPANTDQKDVGYLNDAKVKDMYIWGKNNGFETYSKQWQINGVPQYDYSNAVICIVEKDYESRKTQDALFIEKVRSTFGDTFATTVTKMLNNITNYPDILVPEIIKEDNGYKMIISNSGKGSMEFNSGILKFEFQKRI